MMRRPVLRAGLRPPRRRERWPYINLRLGSGLTPSDAQHDVRLI